MIAQAIGTIIVCFLVLNIRNRKKEKIILLHELTVSYLILAVPVPSNTQLTANAENILSVIQVMSLPHFTFYITTIKTLDFFFVNARSHPAGPIIISNYNLNWQ